jgi:hypothetical protein
LRGYARIKSNFSTGLGPEEEGVVAAGAEDVAIVCASPGVVIGVDVFVGGVFITGAPADDDVGSTFSTGMASCIVDD